MRGNGRRLDWRTQRAPTLGARFASSSESPLKRSSVKGTASTTASAPANSQTVCSEGERLARPKERLEADRDSPPDHGGDAAAGADALEAMAARFVRARAKRKEGYPEKVDKDAP